MSDNDFAVTLEPPDSNGVCCGTSSPEFLKYMAHRLVAINFKIEYSANLPTKPPRTVNYTVAWATFLPSLNSQNQAYDQKVDLFLTMGPGNSLMRDILWG